MGKERELLMGEQKIDEHKRGRGERIEIRGWFADLKGSSDWEKWRDGAVL